MRSTAEVTFRIRQEAANLFLLASKPKFTGNQESPFRVLPEASSVTAALRGSEFVESIEAVAHSIMQHRFPVLGLTLETGPDIGWRRDYLHGKESGIQYFRRIPYLSFNAIGDHKVIWELNRHQHLVVLSQAFLFTGNRSFLDEIVRQLESWFAQNPFQRGINWASALEVAFRALSWMWVYHLAGSEMPAAFRRKFLTGLYRHGRHLAENLSVYFSPNTHLLGEAVALHALGTLFPAFPEAARWRKRGAEVVEAQCDFQVKPDGSHFEQSTYYHVYALDFFLFHYLLANRPEPVRNVIERMAEYLHWLLGPARRISFLGDDDGGRLFHPYGQRDEFGRATLTTCGILFGHREWIGTAEDAAQQAAWWLGAEAMAQANTHRSAASGSRLFRDSGAVFLRCGELFVQMDCGPFGWGGAGHSHSDTLSVVAWLGNERIFIDPGTYTYVGDPVERDWFRGSSAHNTVCIDGRSQAQPQGPFRWASKPEVSLDIWKPSKDGGLVQGTCRYAGFTHRRRVLLKPHNVLVFDEIEAPAGDHTCQQIWQLGPAAVKVRLAFSAETSRTEAVYSPAYGRKESGSAITARFSGPLPARMAMLVQLEGTMSRISIEEAQHMLGDPVFAAS